MKIYIIHNQSYPNGYALTKRFHLYAKGFIENGHESKIIIPKPSESRDFMGNNYTSGLCEIVPYQYCWYTTKRSGIFILRRIHDMCGYLFAGILLVRDKPDVIITSSFPFLFYIYLKAISLIISSLLVREKNEVDLFEKDELSLFDNVKIKYSNHIFDGFITISEKLNDYVKSIIGSKAKTIVVPILLESKEENNRNIIKQKSVVYSGTYIERKDGFMTVLKAFAKLIEKIPEANLILTGKPERSPEYSKIKEIIKENNLERNIIYTGYLENDSLEKLLRSSEVLISIKPFNRQNIYNFPTKVAEYLNTGRPVLTTKVGAVGAIFEDQKTIYFAECTVHDISEKLTQIFLNPEKAASVGIEGKEFASQNFDYHHHCKRMINYFTHFN